MRRIFPANVLLILLFTALGMTVMGYHPGAEDDEIYLSGIKAALHSALFHHDAAFFQLQMRSSVFGSWMSCFMRITCIPLVWSEPLWQLISILLAIWAC